jgi:hypothetical protein
MEGELWEQVYRLIREEASKRPRQRHVVYGDAWVLAVFFWAVVHDRPVCWACEPRNWPEHQRWRQLPGGGTMSGRLRTLSVLQLLAAVLDRLAALAPPESTLVRAVDGKPLPVGGYSKDRDARWGVAAAAAWQRGYKMFQVWGRGVVPDAWTLGPMGEPEPDVAREELVPALAERSGGRLGGYLLGDPLYDSNPVHEACSPVGLQLVAPRKKPGTGLGHRPGGHSPSRLRSIQLTESPAPGDPPAAGPAPFARALYAMRASIERRLGNLCGFGGGLSPLPAWVRRPRRVARWVAAKLVINGLRQCRIQRLTP